jgi:MYXO-CTERM domain-containing protein
MAGSAMAQTFTVGSPTDLVRTTSVGGGTGGGFTNRADFNVDVSGRRSWDAFGDSSNDVILFDVAAALGLPSGSAVTVTGIGWDVEIATTLNGIFGGSWLTEARFTLGSNATPNLIGVRPGFAIPSGGGTQRFTAAVLDFSSAPVPDIALADGILRVEFNETFDDAADQIDADYLANSFLTVRAVPTPGALALMGLGGLIAGRRRR